MIQVIYLFFCQRKKYLMGRDGIVGGGERKCSNKKDNLSFFVLILFVIEIKIFIQFFKWFFLVFFIVLLLNFFKFFLGDNYIEFKGFFFEDVKIKLV